MSGPKGLDSSPVLLCGYPKSGTTLLVSLLDGHEGLLVFPEETRLFRIVEQLAPEEWLEALWSRTGVAQLRRGREDTKSGPRDYTALDFDAYQASVERLWDASDRSPRALMESLVAAYRDALRPGSTGPWLEKTPGNERHLATASGWWPDLRALQIVRDPRAAYCSYLRKRERGGHPLHIDRFLSDWSAYLDHFDAFGATAPGRAHRITYEALVRSPDETLRGVAHFLDVPWDDVLLRPTRAGHAWSGNSMYGTSFAGIDASSADRWRDEIPAAVRTLIEARLGDRMAALGFDDDRRPGSAVVAAARASAASGRGVTGGLRMFARLLGGGPSD